MPITVFPDLLLHDLETRGDAEAVACDGRRLSYAELAVQARELAATLVLHHVRPGDRVAIQLPPGPDEVIALFAVSMVGAVFVNVHHRWKPEQLQHVVSDCEPVAIVTDAVHARRLLALGGAPLLVVRDPIPGLAGTVGWASTSAPFGGGVDIGRDDLCALIYTSGSTGQPKGVMLSHHNLVSGASSVCEFMHNTAEDRLLGALPLCFVYGLSQLTSVFYAGGTYVVQSVPMPAGILATLADERVTGMCAVPPLWLELFAVLRAKPMAFPALRFVASSGGAPPPALLDAFPGMFPTSEIYLMYGLTEAFRSTYLPPHLYAKKRGSIGRATPGNDIYVIDEEHGICGPGQKGELLHRGPVVCKGYWRNEAFSAERIKPCPQLSSLIGDEKVAYSGDIVRVDEDGDLWFVGRRDHMIKRLGFRISPTEVEEIVARHPGVDEAICFAVKDDELVQHVHVCYSGKVSNLDELLQYCRKHMPSYMLPSAFHAWQGTMPRTVNGKLDRQAVIAEFSPEGGRGESTGSGREGVGDPQPQP